MATISELGQRVKAKYPGAYDDMDDAAVGRAVKAKFPGAYDDFSDDAVAGTTTVASHAQGGDDEAKPSDGLGAARFLGPLPYAVDALMRDPAAGSDAIRGGLQGASLGWGDEIASAVDAALPGVLRNEVSREAVGEGETFAERRRNALGYYRGENREAAERSPRAYSAGEFGGAFLPIAVSMGTAAPAAAPAAARTVPLLTRMGVGASQAAPWGAVYGAGGSEGETVGEVGADTLAGGAGAAAIGAGLPALGAAARWAASKLPKRRGPATPGTAATEATAAEATAAAPTSTRLGRMVTPKPTREASVLLSEGVPLTAGLRDPRSVVGQVETASQSLRAAGPLITHQRDVARKATQSAVFNKVLPPGMERRNWTGEADEAVSAIYDGFRAAYDKIRGEELYPAIWRNGKGIPLQTHGKSVGAFETIASNPRVRATADTRAGVKAFLDNEISMLPQREGAVGKVGIEDLLALRSNIRTEIRDTIRGQATREDFAAAKLLEDAEQAVTDAIESQLQAKNAQALLTTLRKIDAQYRNYKIVENAVARAGDRQGGFTGRELSQAIKESTSRGEFARGGGGDLRPLARAYQRTFDESMSPPTGARLLTVGPLGEWVTGPMTYLLNRPRPPIQPPRSLPPSRASTPTAVAADPQVLSLMEALGLLPRRSPFALPVGAAEDQ